MFALGKIAGDGATTLAALNRAQAVAAFSPEGTVETANDLFLDLMGYTMAEIRGRNHAQFVPPAERGGDAYRAFWDSLRCGSRHMREFRRVAKDGREVWVQASYNPILDRSGRVVRIVKFAIDVTAQVARSREDAGKLAALARSQAVIEFATDGTILDANANFLGTMGYGLDEIKGRNHSLFVDPAERSGETYVAFWEALKRGEYQLAEYRRLAKGGREVFIQATYNPITDAEGRVTKVVKFATDITARVHEGQRRAEGQRAIDADLGVIGEAVSDVSRQTGDAAGTVNRVACDIQSVASGAEELSASVGEISEQVSHAARIAGEAVDQTQRTGGIVAGLSDQADQIGNVITLIQGIAAQTNLLALNATIEAARAGAAGKGFAVVAAEVKALAAQTAQATDRIRTQIAATQTATREAVDAIGSIQATIRTLNDVSSAIAAAVEEQSAVTREMSGSMQTAARGVSDLAVGMDTIAQATERVDSATRKVREVSRAVC